MRLTVLFLTSAILIAGAGMSAASEPVFVEPESAEEMKPCDIYGSGWYYLPGSTTCVKIDGDVRVDYSSGARGRQ